MNEKLLSELYVYFWERVFKAEYIRGDGTVDSERVDKKAYHLFTSICAEMNIEVNDEYAQRQFQSALLYAEFGSSPLADDSFYEKWEDMNNSERSLILNEIDAFNKHMELHGYRAEDFTKGERWDRFVKRLKEVMKRANG
jgi:hypothetical protein